MMTIERILKQGTLVLDSLTIQEVDGNGNAVGLPRQQSPESWIKKADGLGVIKGSEGECSQITHVHYKSEESDSPIRKYTMTWDNFEYNGKLTIIEVRADINLVKRQT